MTSSEFRGFYTVDIFDCEPFEMFTAGDDPLAEYILHEKRFEPHSIRTMQRLLDGASCFIDIGANVGAYSMVAAKTHPKLPVFAFEPNPLAYARLTLHVKINGLDDRVNVFPMALGAANGHAHFAWVRKTYGWISSGGCLFADPAQIKPHHQAAVVAVRRLDDMPVFPEGRALVKCDVEGGEAVVFTGMQNFLKARKPDIILESFFEENCRIITEMTKPLGYRYYKIEESGSLTEQDRVLPADQKSDSFNQLLTVTAGAA